MRGARQLFLVVVALAACRAGPKDLEQWRVRAEDGPERLAALMKEPGASLALRSDAALALVHVVRRGRHVGIPLFADAIAGAPNRDAILEAIAPTLTDQIRAMKEPSEGDAFVEKDAITLVLTRGLASGPAKAALETALATWLEKASFPRLEDERQRYSLETTAALLGARGATVLDDRLWGAQVRPLRYVRFIFEHGDDATKEHARDLLAKTARYVAEPWWRDKARAEVDAANAKNGLRPSPDQVRAQLVSYQTNVLRELYDAILVSGGGRSAIYALLDAAFPESCVREVAVADRLGTEARLTAISTLGAFASTLDDSAIDRFVRDALDPTREDGEPIGVAALAVVARTKSASKVTALLDAKSPAIRRDAALAIEQARGTTKTAPPKDPYANEDLVRELRLGLLPGKR